MKKVISLIALVVFCVYTHAQDFALCEEDYQTAEEAFKKKDYENAKLYYGNVIEECGVQYANCKARLAACEKAIADATAAKKTVASPPKQSPVQSQTAAQQQPIQQVALKTELIATSKRFTVNKSAVEFTEYGGKVTIKVTADNDWDIYDEPKWVEILRKGNNLTISCEANTFRSAREGDIVLMDDDNQEISIAVSQYKNNDYLSLSANYIDDQKGSGGKYTIEVSSNKPWKVKNTPQWCNITKEGEKLSISLTQNRTGLTRQAEIEVIPNKSEFLKKTITIRQSDYQGYLKISPELITANEGKSGVATIHVDTDLPNYYIEDIPHWCEIKNKNATSFTIEIKDNSGGQARTANCHVIAGENSKTLVIKQGSRLNYVNVYPQIVTASKNGGTISIKVSSSGTWRVVNLPDWCTVEEQKNDSFILSIMPNTGSARNATFSVSSQGIRAHIEVKQE